MANVTPELDSDFESQSPSPQHDGSTPKSRRINVPILGVVPAPLAPPVVMVVLLSTILLIFAPSFFRTGNLRAVLLDAAIIMIVGIGMNGVLTGRGIDLSVGGILILSSVVMGAAIKDFGVPVPIAMVLGIATGALCGYINGSLIIRLGIPDFIATLSTELMFRGLALVYLGGAVFFGFGPAVIFMGRGRIFGIIPTPIFAMFVIGIIAHAIMTWHRVGIRLHAVGQNPMAARRMGVNVTKYRIGSFVASGLLAAVGGVILTGRLDAVVATGAVLILLQSIAAALVGGANLFGGRAAIIGTMVGAVLLAMIANALVQLGFELFWQHVAMGAVIIITLAINSRAGKREFQAIG